jgi:hypothetical protein
VGAEMLAVLAVCALCIILSIHKKNVLLSIQVITLVALGALSIIQTVTTQKAFTAYTKIAGASGESASEDAGNVFEFSQSGRNVVLFMLDKAMSFFLPTILEEKPELKTIFSGFTYYPNCVSLGGLTLFGVPPLFGGYEYAPDKIGGNSGVPLVEKHNQALLVLPRIFMENGYQVTVTDQSWANYNYKADLSIYDAYPQIRTEKLVGKETGFWLKTHPEAQVIDSASFLKDNLLRFSFLRIAPPALRFFIYDDGKWLAKIETRWGALPLLTLDEYVALAVLPAITTVVPEEKNTFTIIVNDLTHEAAFFEAPDYTPQATVRNRGPSRFADDEDYHVNMAALLLLADYFMFLKEAQAYDNTRVIIVADHGWNMGLEVSDNITLPNGERVESYNPLLLVKDFDGQGALQTDSRFMTNADTPLLATDNLIADAVNPWTGKKLQAEKQDGVTITTSGLWSPDLHSKYAFNITPDQWLHVHDNIFDPENWEHVNK